MTEASWALARTDRLPLFREVLRRELRHFVLRLPVQVWLPASAASLMAYAWNGLMDADLYVPAIGAVVFVILGYRQCQLARKEPTACDLALWSGFGRDGAWLVDLIVLQDSAPTGADRGMLWIEGGRLLFVGGATSFGLQPSQAAGRCRWSRAVPGLCHGLTLPLAHRTELGWLALSFSPVLDPEERAEIGAAVDGWTEGRPTGGGQYPPTTVGPGATPTTGLVACAALSTLFWIGAAVFASWGKSPVDVAVRLGIGAAVAWPLDQWFLAKRWRAVRDRRGAA